MAPARAPLASGGVYVVHSDVELTYATPAACAALATASEGELLPDATPAARVRLEKTASADGGCTLRVELSSAGETGAVGRDNVFEAAAALDANVAALSESARLRDAAGSLELERMTLKVATNIYTVLLRGGEKQPGSNLVLFGAKCAPQLRDEALVLRHVMPSGVDAGKLTIEPTDDVAVAGGHALDCAAVLTATARAPLLLPGAMDDALSYLRTLDANMAATFGTSERQRVFASVQLHGPASVMASNALLGQEAAASTESAASPYNAPTKQMTMGILVALVGLVAMLVAVAMKKRSHEKACEARYDNASKAAQIHRVSIRMASPRHSRDAFGHEEEEEKEYEAYGEDDGLL